jgi:hypothetical protein
MLCVAAPGASYGVDDTVYVPEVQDNKLQLPLWLAGCSKMQSPYAPVVSVSYMTLNDPLLHDQMQWC